RAFTNSILHTDGNCFLDGTSARRQRRDEPTSRTLAVERINGFILPYLGQLDAELPVSSQELVPRSEVIQYPTDFAAMPEKWIDKLSTRGEQLTRVLACAYLKE